MEEQKKAETVAETVGKKAQAAADTVEKNAAKVAATVGKTAEAVADTVGTDAVKVGETVGKHAIEAGETVGKHAIAVGETVAKNKMSTLGSVASALSICMYVSYIPQIIGNLSGHPGDWIQPSVAFVNCTLWVIYGLFRKKPEWPLVFANAPGIIFGLTAAITARM
ncbi:membrane protein [Selenomonas flueggei]|uniref:Uncharacterized protein n=1 Tax=Selenomonas flueggei ATCC 43531 TaxID=638302 RepID=C4V229_9FIRM|nr:membrane protein [Selenomonas flueggei]EEQ49160.1 hypothetical protein HMPREF0908_0476 [Selenomonas flueggei ATCC 43531]